MDLQKKRVLIAGLGYLGEALAEELHKAGHQVFGLRRQAPKHSLFPVIAADLTDPGSMQGKIPECEVIFYMPGAKQRDPKHYQAIYQAGLQNLLAAMPGNPKRLFYISSTSVYADSGGEWVDEKTAAESDSVTGKIISDAEVKLILPRSNASSLRLGGIYGPGRESFLDRVLAGDEKPDAKLVRYTNRIHRDDAVAACIHLMNQHDLQPVYNIVDQDPAARNEVITWILEQAGKKPQGTQDGLAPRGNKRVSSRLLAESGFVWKYPSFRDGYRELLGKRQAGIHWRSNASTS